jgi:hypothetical protein
VCDASGHEEELGPVQTLGMRRDAKKKERKRKEERKKE